MEPIMLLNQQMSNYLDEFNLLAEHQHIKHTQIENYLISNTDSIFVNYHNIFFQILTDCDDLIIDKFCKKIVKQSPTIIYIELMKYYKKFLSKSNRVANFDNLKYASREEKIDFLAYVLCIEVYVLDYIDRINKHIL